MANMMISGLSEMKSTFEKSKLIASLQTYREQHEKDYNDALDVFREDVQNKLKAYLKKAKDADFTKFDVSHNLGLTAPVDCRKAYDNIIKILQASNDETISLTLSEANMILANDWDWIQSASVSNSFYSSRKR
jgi:hypothetical protein